VIPEDPPPGGPLLPGSAGVSVEAGATEDEPVEGALVDGVEEGTLAAGGEELGAVAALAAAA
jgi:hypothetical protein